MGKRLSRMKEYFVYTAASYADAAMSIPLWAAKQVRISADAINDKFNPQPVPRDSWEGFKEHTPLYKTRASLREKLDSEPGTKYLANNIVALIPFVAVGMPAAELTQAGVNATLSDAPKLLQHVGTSLGTLAFQMCFGYTTYMVSEVITNRPKYVDDKDKIKFGKVKDGLLLSAKTFFAFDISYTLLKTGAQAYCLYNGEDAWKASVLADSAVIPLWYALAIAMGLAGGLIETDYTEPLTKKTLEDKTEE